jgi:2-succinyl-5-enolpyruvyl-6-hydroxy-3-cyclohexene-1-carboxylate synthase
MPEPPESELADAALESAALPQEDYAAGDLRRLQRAPGQPHLDQAAAVPTYGVLQVNLPSEEPLFTNEIETDSGEATQPPASSDTQAASTVTTGVVAGASLQQFKFIIATLFIYYQLSRIDRNCT